MASIFSRAKVAPPLLAPAPSRKAAVPPPSRKPDSNPQLGVVQDPPSVESYGDVPKFVRVVTEGERALFRLPDDALNQVVVIELAGRKLVIYVSRETPPSNALLDSMRGAFLAEQYSILGTKIAPQNVISAIRSAASNAQDAGGARSSNAYMTAVHEWILYAVENRATDIHIEVRGSTGTVRFRVDGELEEMRTETRGMYPAVFAEKCMGSLFNNEQQRKSGSDSLFDAGKNLYCMVPYSEIPGHTLKLRYQSIKGNEGPKTILRLLPVNENAKTLTFGELGYAESHIRLWNSAMQTPSGAVIISGITGSGKSTTQKCFVELNPAAPTSAIFTVEDPVEYPIRYAHQVPLQRDLSDPEESARLYSEVITALMRADPDVVMLGEIRDRASANAMQQMVETGHMGLGTLHAHLISGMVPRLVNPELGMNREILTGPNMLTLLVYQALVPRLCLDCAHTTSDARESNTEVRQVLDHLSQLRVDTSPLRWRRIGGCTVCSGRGTIGQTVVSEMIMPDEDWLRPIREGRDVDAVEAFRSASDGDLNSGNMDGKTVFEHTLWKALQGVVDARQCSRFDNFGRFVKRHVRAHK